MSETRSSTKKTYELSYLFTNSPRKFYEKICEECSRNNDPSKAWKIIEPKEKHCLFNEVFQSRENEYFTSEEIKKFVNSRFNSKKRAQTYVRLVMKLNKFLGLTLHECWSLIRYAHKVEKGILNTEQSRLLRTCVRLYFQNRDYVISSFLRILVEVYSVGGDKNVQANRIFFKRNVLHPNSPEWLSLVLRAIFDIHSVIVEKPSKNVYVQSEKLKLGRILIYLCYDTYYSIAYIDHLMEYTNVLLKTYLENGFSQIIGKTTPIQLRTIKEESRELVYIMLVCLYRVMDCRDKKLRISENAYKVDRILDIKDVETILNCTEKHESYGKLRARLSMRYSMIVDDEHEEYLKHGVRGFFCFIHALYMRNRAVYQKKNNQEVYKLTAKAAAKYFDMSMIMETNEFIGEILLKREFLDEKSGSMHSLLANSIIERMFMDLFEGEASGVTILFPTLERELRFLKRGWRFPRVPEGEAKFRFWKKRLEDPVKGKADTFRPVYENLWKVLQVVYKKNPRCVPKMINEEKQRMLFLFLFRMSPDFLKDIQKFRDFDPGYSASDYFRLLAVLSKNSEVAKNVFIDLQQNQFFTWERFFREIKVMMENSGRIENTGYESRLVSVLKLIETIALSYPLSRQAFFDRAEMNIISLFDLVSYPHTTQKLMGQLFKMFSSFVDATDSRYMMDLWKSVENIQNFPIAISHAFVNVEHKKREYSETVGFMKLFCRFVEEGAIFQGSTSARSPWEEREGFFNPLFHFCKTYVFEPFDLREYKNPEEKWSLVLYCLRIFYTLLNHYQPSQIDFLRKDCRFVLMKDMLTRSKFLNTIFRILFEGKFYQQYVMREKVILYCLKIMDVVLQKQEEFRIAKLEVVEQKDGPSSSIEELRKAGSSRRRPAEKLVKRTEIDGIFHLIPLYEQFSTSYIIKMLNYLHSPFLSEIRFHTIRILGVLSENRTNLVEIFVTREKHKFLMRLMIENLKSKDEKIRMAILDLLGNNVLNQKSISHFLCGLSEPPEEYYLRHSLDNNCLSVLLSIVVKNEKMLSNQFLEKCYEVILRLCEDGRIRKRMFLNLEKNNFFNNSLRYFSKEKFVRKEVKVPVLSEGEALMDTTSESSGENRSNSESPNKLKIIGYEKVIQMEPEKPLYYYTGMGYLLKIVALKIYHDTRKYENEEERKANLAGLEELVSHLFYHFDPNQPQTMTMTMRLPSSSVLQKRQKKTLMSELLDELNHNKFHKLPEALLPFPIPELMNLIEKDCLYVTYSLNNQSNVGSVSRGIGEIRQYSIVRIHKLITMYRSKNPKIAEALTPEISKKIGYNALAWNEFYKYSASFKHFFSGWRMLFDTTLMLYQSFDISYIFPILRALLLKIRLQEIDKAIESDLAHLIFRCMITLRSAKSSSKYLLSPSQCITVAKEIFAVFSKSGLSQEARTSLYLATINYLRYTATFLPASVTHESLSIGLFSPIRGSSTNKTVFQVLCEDGVKLHDRGVCVALSTIEMVLSYDLNGDWVRLIARKNGFLTKLIDHFESFPSVLFPQTKKLKRDLMMDEEIAGYSISTERTLISRYRQERELMLRRVMVFESLTSLLNTILSSSLYGEIDEKEEIEGEEEEEEEEEEVLLVRTKKKGWNGVKQTLFEYSYRVFQVIIGDFSSLMERQFGPTTLYGTSSGKYPRQSAPFRGAVPIEQRLLYHQLLMPLLRLILVITTSNSENKLVLDGLLVFVSKFERFFVSALSSKEFSSPHLEEMKLMYMIFFEIARMKRLQDEKNTEETDELRDRGAVERVLVQFESKILESFSFFHQKYEQDEEKEKRKVMMEGSGGVLSGFRPPKRRTKSSIEGGLLFDPDMSIEDFEKKKRNRENVDLGREKSVYLRRILREREQSRERKRIVLFLMDSFLSFVVKRHPRILFSNLVKVQYSSLDMTSTTSSYYPELKKSSISLLFRVFLRTFGEVERIHRRFRLDEEDEEVMRSRYGIMEHSREWKSMICSLEKTLFLIYYHLKFYLVNAITERDMMEKRYWERSSERMKIRVNVLPKREKRELLNNCRVLMKPLDRLRDMSVLKGREYLLYLGRSILKLIRTRNFG